MRLRENSDWGNRANFQDFEAGPKRAILLKREKIVQNELLSLSNQKDVVSKQVLEVKEYKVKKNYGS